MAVKTRDELMETIKARLGEQTDDETISFLEDVSDTLTDLESKTKDATDWKTKYEENDKQWRNKYKERFFNNEGNNDDDKDDDLDDEFEDYKFSSLFSKEDK